MLDNFEQVAVAAPVLGDLLSACANLSLLVTSREPLALGWEQLFELGPLDCPSADQSLEVIGAGAGGRTVRAAGARGSAWFRARVG